MPSLPNGLLLVTLVSNFGTFVLYGLTNIVCIVAFHEHHDFHGFKHMVVPVFGAIANFACIAFYIIGPLEGLGSAKEPLIAVGFSVIWGIYGAIYFVRNSKKKGKQPCGSQAGLSGVIQPVNPRADRSMRRPPPRLFAQPGQGQVAMSFGKSIPKNRRHGRAEAADLRLGAADRYRHRSVRQ